MWVCCIHGLLDQCRHKLTCSTVSPSVLLPARGTRTEPLDFRLSPLAVMSCSIFHWCLWVFNVDIKQVEFNLNPVQQKYYNIDLWEYLNVLMCLPASALISYIHVFNLNSHSESYITIQNRVNWHQGQHQHRLSTVTVKAFSILGQIEGLVGGIILHRALKI